MLVIEFSGHTSLHIWLKTTQPTSHINSGEEYWRYNWVGSKKTVYALMDWLLSDTKLRRSYIKNLDKSYYPLGGLDD